MYGTCFPDYAYLLPARSWQFTIHKFQKRGIMPIPRFSAALIAGLIVSAAFAPNIFAQTTSSNSGPAVQAKETKLEHFDPELVDKSTRLNSSHVAISYAVFCLKKEHLSTAFSRQRDATCPPCGITSVTLRAI